MAARLLACLLVAALSPGVLGCFVFEELDKGQRIMEDPASGFEEEPSASEGSSGSAQASSGKERGEGEEAFDPAKWWRKARTFTPGEGGGGEEGSEGSALVSCRLDGGSRYMRRDECLGRGGTPAG